MSRIVKIINPGTAWPSHLTRREAKSLVKRHRAEFLDSGRIQMIDPTAEGYDTARMARTRSARLRQLRAIPFAGDLRLLLPYVP